MYVIPGELLVYVIPGELLMYVIPGGMNNYQIIIHLFCVKMSELSCSQRKYNCFHFEEDFYSMKKVYSIYAAVETSHDFFFRLALWTCVLGYCSQ